MTTYEKALEEYRVKARDALNQLIVRAEKAERELGEAQKELETVRMDAAKEAARAARTILGNERTRAEAAEAKVRELEASADASHLAASNNYAAKSKAEADLLRERERVKELEERLEQWEGPPHAKAAKPLHGKTTLGRLQVEQERVRELEGVLRWIAFGEGHPIGDGSPKDEARAALSHHKTYGEVAQIPSEGPGRGAGAGEREQPVVNRKDVGSSAPALVSHPKEVKPLPRPDDESPCYRKFDVTRADGSSEPGKKHERCDYFVLDWTHDKYAKPAALAYADACESEFPELAGYLRKRAAEPHPAKEGT